MNQRNDGQLLTDVAVNSSQASFEEVARRHGVMIFNECRRMLADLHDAEDAAQAVFFVLWKKADSLGKKRTVALWLHRVARNVCRNARRARNVRKLHEQRAAVVKQQPSTDADSESEIQGLLDEDIDRLQEKYRLPIILFYLEGRSIEEVAALMNIKSSAVTTRLSRARDLLRARMARRGIEVSGAVLTAAISVNAGANVLPTEFFAMTAQHAGSFAAGTISTSGTLATQMALANGILRMMSIAQLKSVAVTVVAALSLGGAAVAIVASTQTSPDVAADNPQEHIAISSSDLVAEAAADSARPGTSDPIARASDTAALIAKVRENERLFQKLEATVKKSRVISAGPKSVSESTDLGPPTVTAIEEIDRMTTQQNLFSFFEEETVSFASGEKSTIKRKTMFDGSKTIAIIEGNSATVFQGGYAPARMAPPHCWGIFSLDVNFPLSVYLHRTDGQQSEAKVHDAEIAGAEKVGDFDCVKVKVSPRNNPNSIQYLWLAKDRNYHVAKCAIAYVRNGKEEPSDETRVKQWREVAKGIWLPAVVTSENFRIDREGKKNAVPYRVRQLSLENAALDATLPADAFKLPPVPDSVPTFVMSADGRLEDDPQHIRPARADASTTINLILDRLASEEAKYDQLEVVTTNRYQMLKLDEQASGGMHISSETEERSVLAGDRMFYSETQQSKLASGAKTSLSIRQCYDSHQLREFVQFKSGGSGFKVQDYAELSLGRPADMLVRAHTTVFRGDRNRQSLAGFLRSGSFGMHQGVSMTVEYVGDELVGGLHCYKLNCDLLVGQGNSFFVWLARDRNLIAVRHEWHEPNWSEKLPTGIRYVDDLREIRPGIWFPNRTIHLAFQKIDRGFGERECGTLLQWRREITVKSLQFNPAVDDKLFREIHVPAGITVTVKDEKGTSIGQYKQPQVGNIDVPTEKLLEMKQTSRVNEGKKGRRQQ